MSITKLLRETILEHAASSKINDRAWLSLQIANLRAVEENAIGVIEPLQQTVRNISWALLQLNKGDIDEVKSYLNIAIDNLHDIEAINSIAQ